MALLFLLIRCSAAIFGKRRALETSDCPTSSDGVCWKDGQRPVASLYKDTGQEQEQTTHCCHCILQSQRAHTQYQRNGNSQQTKVRSAPISANSPPEDAKQTLSFIIIIREDTVDIAY